MNNDIPRLVILDLYRNALKTVEKLSRAAKDRTLHAWSVKAIRECGDLIIQMAHDEMDENMVREEEKQEKADEEFYQ